MDKKNMCCVRHKILLLLFQQSAYPLVRVRSRSEEQRKGVELPVLRDTSRHVAKGRPIILWFFLRNTSRHTCTNYVANAMVGGQ